MKKGDYKSPSPIHRIEMEINNGRTMQLAQQAYDGTILFTTYNTASGLVDHEEDISPGDMVMLLNYYRYSKERGLPLMYQEKKTFVEELSEKYGWPMKIKARGYIAYLCDIQSLNAGESPLPVYRFPGGESLVDTCEMIPAE